jgi:heme-degrading monooxygenase HmoA
MGAMFVALSKLAVANGMSEQVKHAFRQCPHLVDSALGFVRLDIISPTDNSDEIWLITYWKTNRVITTGIAAIPIMPLIISFQKA